MAQPFADIFSSFLDGHTSFEALQTALWNSLADNTASREQIAQTIESGFREGRLPFQVYFALKDAMDNVPGSMAHAPAELGKDATRISSMPQPDATQIRRAAKGIEDRRGAEATQIRRAADETRIRPASDRITTGPTTGTAPATIILSMATCCS